VESRKNIPDVARILEILRKKEATGEITVAEHEEFFVLNDELLGAHEFIHGKIIHPTGEVGYWSLALTKSSNCGLFACKYRTRSPRRGRSDAPKPSSKHQHPRRSDSQRRFAHRTPLASPLKKSAGREAAGSASADRRQAGQPCRWARSSGVFLAPIRWWHTRTSRILVYQAGKP
jgi:hypothetical protein